jgi:transcriptional regulator with GAF, ATPase, and Fis domain
VPIDETPVLDLLSDTTRALASPAMDAQDVLRQLLDRLVTLFGAADGGILLCGKTGRPEIAVTTSSQARIEEMLRLREGDGPCREAFTTATVVRAGSAAEVAELWPAWAAAGRPAYESVLGVPFVVDGRCIGTVILLSERPQAFDAGLARTVHRVAEVVTVVLLMDRELDDAQRVSAQLHHALESRVIIEQAKGVLAERLRIAPDDGFALLRTRARATGRKLTVVAEAVVRGIDVDRA